MSVSDSGQSGPRGGATEAAPSYPSSQDGSAPARPRNGLGVAALVLGILAIVGCWSALAAIILGILAVIFGIVGVRRANRRTATNKGVAIGGLVTGAIGLLLGIVFAIAFGAFLSVFGNEIHGLQQCLQQAGSDHAKVQQCDQQYQQQVNNKTNGG